MTNRSGGPATVLILYVAGPTPRSIHAIESLRRVCAEVLQGDVELRVVDIHQDPGAASSRNIAAVPTLVKELPPPLQRFVGDLLAERLVLSIEVQAAAAEPDRP